MKKLSDYKPFIQWINELPELIRDAVIADYDGTQMLCGSMANAIFSACLWRDSSMGPEFYEALYFDAIHYRDHNLEINGDKKIIYSL